MSKELKPCPFLCELRDLEIDGTSKVIGYMCKGQCHDCQAHRPNEEALKAENERLREALNEIRTIGDCTAMIEDVVARGMMRKIAFDALFGKTIIKLFGTDTNVPANAPDTEKGGEDE